AIKVDNQPRHSAVLELEDVGPDCAEPHDLVTARLVTAASRAQTHENPFVIEVAELLCLRAKIRQDAHPVAKRHSHPRETVPPARIGSVSDHELDLRVGPF